MAVISLVGTLRDGSSPEPPEIAALTPQRIDWPRGEDGLVKMTINGADGDPADLTGCALVLTVRPRNTTGGTPIISRVVDILVAADGTAQAPLEAADTAELAERSIYRYDVWLTDTDNERHQVVPDSPFVIGPAAGEAGDVATVVSTSAPAARFRGVFDGEDPEDLLVGDLWMRSDTGELCAQFAADDTRRTVMVGDP